MKKKSFKKFGFKVRTISNLQSDILGGAASPSPLERNSYRDSCKAGVCLSINEISMCYPCDR